MFVSSGNLAKRDQFLYRQRNGQHKEHIWVTCPASQVLQLLSSFPRAAVSALLTSACLKVQDALRAQPLLGAGVLELCVGRTGHTGMQRVLAPKGSKCGAPCTRWSSWPLLSHLISLE